MRIERYTIDDDGIDDIVARRSTIHLERLNSRDWSLIIECRKQRIHLNARNVRLFEAENCEPTKAA